MALQICSKCQTENGKKRTQCWKCGTPLRKVEETAAVAQPVEATPAPPAAESDELKYEPKDDDALTVTRGELRETYFEIMMALKQAFKDIDGLEEKIESNRRVSDGKMDALDPILKDIWSSVGGIEERVNSLAAEQRQYVEEHQKEENVLFNPDDIQTEVAKMGPKPEPKDLAEQSHPAAEPPSNGDSIAQQALQVDEEVTFGLPGWLKEMQSKGPEAGTTPASPPFETKVDTSWWDQPTEAKEGDDFVFEPLNVPGAQQPQLQVPFIADIPEEGQVPPQAETHTEAAAKKALLDHKPSEILAKWLGGK